MIKDGFISKFNHDGLEKIYVIPREEYEYYWDFKKLELKGFTDKAKEWSGFRFKDIDMTGIENAKRPLGEI